MSDRARMSPAQHTVLRSADETGQLTITDRRTVKALARRGWAEAVTRRTKKKTTTQWIITAAGRAARDNDPIITQRPPIYWPDVWTRQRSADGNRYVISKRKSGDHELIRLHRGMLWQVRCPLRPEDKPVAYRQYLGEAVDELGHHLARTDACGLELSPDPRS
ncbi:hypothetical protein [Kutzneria buriramensis]|uniref:Uncharacterized protein n=1 Tax=Kutzneria buriramensis TaxID=1045776 RepID=A0A3E0GXS3_9PSEU|nr:hypothetical protein [Kutzneria buriramensis]REH31074.1 hypothetical protein BCF44_12297 [Kutzneria buriramensis]